MNAEEAIDRIATERAVNVAGAASAVGVSPWTIRQWVKRGHLERIPGFRELMFFESDVYACRTARRSESETARVAALAQSWRGVQ